MVVTGGLRGRERGREKERDRERERQGIRAPHYLVKSNQNLIIPLFLTHKMKDPVPAKD